MEFIQRFRAFAGEKQIPLQSAPILLAVSGGVDSMVMLHVFKSLGLDFGIAHCNFKLRGDASDGDEALVKQTAVDMDVPCFVKHFDTKDFAGENGISTQMAARDLRYAWFTALAAEHGYRGVATAHNLNDSVETFLLNFVRGTGLSGLIGIHANQGLWYRPLLFATRDEILDYAHEHNVVWREDSSNTSDVYARNFLRHQILPKMEALNPNFLRTAERNLTKLGETNDNLLFLYRHFLQGKNADPADEHGSFSFDKALISQLPAPRRVLREMLKHYGFTEDQSRQVAENIDKIGFQLSSNTGWELLCERTAIVVRSPAAWSFSGSDGHPNIQIQRDDLLVRLSDGTALFLVATDPASPYPDGTEAILVDAAVLQFPLTVRHWQEGDVFQPFGMAGKRQKLQDFYTNQKMLRGEKDRMWLLVNGDGAIIWVMGMRLDDRFKVVGTTLSALKIMWQ
jgi:tRNA(Ile)-lysidine synthase